MEFLPLLPEQITIPIHRIPAVIAKTDYNSNSQTPAVIAKTDYNSSSQTKTMAVVVKQPMAMEFMLLLPKQITIPIHRPRPWLVLWNNLWQWNSCRYCQNRLQFQLTDQDHGCCCGNNLWQWNSCCY